MLLDRLAAIKAAASMFRLLSDHQGIEEFQQLHGRRLLLFLIVPERNLWSVMAKMLDFIAKSCLISL
jgi:hypothetical protein